MSINTDDSSSFPDWDCWSLVPFVKLTEAVALSVNVDPKLIIRMGVDYRLLHAQATPGELVSAQFHKRLLIAARALEMKEGITPRPGALPGPRIEEQGVLLRDFARWAVALEWELPSELKDMSHRPDKVSPSESIEDEVRRWPWGDHETELLRMLARAAREFWSTYDPDDPATAPRSRDVERWLRGEGVAQRVAVVMAQILRPEDLRTGPRGNSRADN